MQRPPDGTKPKDILGCVPTFPKAHCIWLREKAILIASDFAPHPDSAGHLLRMTLPSPEGSPKRASTDMVAATIEDVVTAIRLEAERRDLGVGTIVISAERLRRLMREFFLG